MKLAQFERHLRKLCVPAKLSAAETDRIALELMNAVPGPKVTLAAVRELRRLSDPKRNRAAKPDTRFDAIIFEHWIEERRRTNRTRMLKAIKAL